MSAELISMQGGQNSQVSNFLPAMTITEALQRRSQMVLFVQNIMVEGVDFGKIPGTGDSPTLLKPGAEKLCSFFGLVPHFEEVRVEEDWTGMSHIGEPFFNYDFRCSLSRNGVAVAEGNGSCNSWEKKYRYRKADRLCPSCGQPTIIVGKEEYGGGWVCFSKRGGCGAKFAEDDRAITSQKIGLIPNPDIYDQVNTIKKMAMKRALVAAVLLAVGASQFFTQDMEDFGDGQAEAQPSPQATAQPNRTQQPRTARASSASVRPGDMPFVSGDKPCPQCHAPVGKKHTNICKIGLEILEDRQSAQSDEGGDTLDAMLNEVPENPTSVQSDLSGLTR